MNFIRGVSTSHDQRHQFFMNLLRAELETDSVIAAANAKDDCWLFSIDFLYCITVKSSFSSLSGDFSTHYRKSSTLYLPTVKRTWPISV